MKRLKNIMCVLLVVMLLVPPVSGVWADNGCFAGEQTLVSESVEYYEDGSMLVTAVYEVTVLTRTSLYNKAGRKVYEYREADGNILWAFAVNGEFRVIEGASVTCTSASCSTSIYNDAWRCTRKSAAPSGSQAVANGVFEKTLLGIVLSTENVNVTLSCDPYGNLY